MLTVNKNRGSANFSMTKFLLFFVFYIQYCVLLADDEGNEGNKGIKKSVSAVDDELYDQVMDIVENKIQIKLTHALPKALRKVYNMIQKVDFDVYDPVQDSKQKRLIVFTDENESRIVPKKSEIVVIIKHFYNTYKGEGARKLNNRIKSIFTGISRQAIQDWLNSNEEHFQRKPLFTNKPPLQPVTAHTVQSTHQIDLVSMENYPVEKDGVTYTWVLSVIDVFSRFLQLRPMTGKKSEEVVI